MKINILLFFSALMVLSSCTENKPYNKAKNKLHIAKEGFEFHLFQRNKIEIPSDSANVFFRIDDITGGQTQAILKSGNRNLLAQSLQEGEVVNFNLNSEKYSIECIELINKLIGEDYGEFKIIRLSEKKMVSTDESDQIEKLLKKIEKSDITFIRNGSEYTSKEAADHLRSKWESSDGRIKTLDDFIKNIASKSSMSGKAYLVKLKNGTVMPAEKWYREE